MKRFFTFLPFLFFLCQPCLAQEGQDVISIKSNLVVLNVRVSEGSGLRVANLPQGQFQVFEDEVEQEIAFFNQADEPISIGILLDVSGSMVTDGKIEEARKAAVAFIRHCNPKDEAFFIRFDDHAAMACPFTQDFDRLATIIEQSRPFGGTAMYDAVLNAVNYIKKGKHLRQALLVITDGRDEHSKHKLQEMLKLIQESDVQVFTIGIFSPLEQRIYKRGGPIQYSNGTFSENPGDVLEQMAKETGGDSFIPQAPSELTGITLKIAEELRTQYTLAYYPSQNGKPGDYHAIRVHVQPVEKPASSSTKDKKKKDKPKSSQSQKYAVKARPGYREAEEN